MSSNAPQRFVVDSGREIILLPTDQRPSSDCEAFMKMLLSEITLSIFNGQLVDLGNPQSEIRNPQ